MEKQDFKVLRESKGFTLESLADAVDTAPQAVVMWEVGECLPCTDKVVKLCNVLDVCVEKLMHSFPKWEKDHGEEWECRQNCADCPNVLMNSIICDSEEKAPSGEGESFNTKYAAVILGTIRNFVGNLNFDAGDFVRGWIVLKGTKPSEVVMRADYVAELNKIISYLEKEGMCGDGSK